MDKSKEHQAIKPCKVGRCVICQKDTLKTCPKCLSVFYCNAEHRNQDRKEHKKTCVVKGPSWLEINDICDIAALVFTDKFMIPDRHIAFAANVPHGIKNTGDGNKYFCLTEVSLLDCPF
jgi:hypothetical protein